MVYIKHYSYIDPAGRFSRTYGTGYYSNPNIATFALSDGNAAKVLAKEGTHKFLLGYPDSLFFIHRRHCIGDHAAEGQDSETHGG